jgi:DNA-binding MarR family transcriptional regulator
MKLQAMTRDIARLQMQLMGVSRHLRQEAHADERSWARLLVLGSIDRHGGTATPSVLATDANMKSSNVAAILRELEANKLIERRPDAEDRRKVRLRLSTAGRKLLRDSRSRRDRWLASALNACLTAAERIQLIQAGYLLERIMVYSGSIPADHDLRRRGEPLKSVGDTSQNAE